MKSIYLSLISVLLLLSSCKKENIKPNPEDPASAVPLPDSLLIVNSVDQTSGASAVYLLNATSGTAVKKYTYPADASTTWSYPVAGNNLVYTLQSNKINAIDISTGKLIWTDAITNAITPILHLQTFFGVRQENSSSYEVYSLDATRQSNDFSWRYKLSAAPVKLSYFNDIIYVLTDATHITALDAKTGAAKWSIAASQPISVNALREGVFIAGKIIYDAATGAPMSTAGAVNIPLFYGESTIVRSELLYATQSAYFLKTGHYQPNSNSGVDFNKDFLSIVDRSSGTEKQRIQFGEGYVLVPNSNVITQMWNNKLIVNESHMEPAKFNGTYSSNRYGMLPADLSSELITFEARQLGRSSDYTIAGNMMYYYKVFLPPSGIIPFVPTSANQFLAVDLLTGKQQWNNDKSFDDFKGWAMSYCVYTGGKGFSTYIQ